jgi:hypothetical protein
MTLFGPSLSPLTWSSKSEEDEGCKMENYQKMEKIGEGKASRNT